MPETNETGPKGGEDKKEQAKAEVKKKIEEANQSTNPDEVKKKLGELGKKLADELRDAIEKEGKAQKQEEVSVKKDEVRDVTIKVIKVIEAVKQGLGVENIATKPQAQVFLQEVVRQIPSPSPSQCNQLAAYLTPYLLGDKDIIINPPDQSKSEFQTDFEALAQADPDLARQVKEALLKAVDEGKLKDLDRATVEKGLSETIEKRKEGEKDSEGEKINSLKKIQEQLDFITAEIFQTINDLELEQRLKVKIETKIVNENPNLESEQRIKLVDQELLKETTSIRGSLRAGFNEILGARNKEELNTAISNLASEISSFLSKGYLSNEEAEKLREKIKRVVEVKNLASDMFSSLRFNEAKKELEYFRVQLTKKSEKVALALFSTDDFIDYLTERGYLENGRLKEGFFGELYEEIRELFEEIISIVDSKPGQYFDNAFSYLYEGAYYNLLVQRLIKIGGELGEKLPKLKSSQILIDDPRMLRYYYDSEKGAERRMAYPGGQIIESLDRAIGIVLAQDMSRLLNIHRALHNVEFVVEQGAGFEELTKYIDQISINEITWLFRTNPEIVEAYNLYLKNLIEELALNNWVIPTNFGLKDRENLDYAQRLTVCQLLAKKGVDGVREFYKTARSVRMASAVTKAFTGEFWSILLTSKFLIGEKEEGKDRGKIEFLFSGSHQRGVEKMLGTIDIIKVWERFGTPSDYPQIQYVYIPRKLEGHKYEAWNHRRVYWVKEQIESALVLGPTDEFLQFLKENALIGEVLRKPTLSILDRGGWRLEEYKVFLRKTENGIDFHTSINNLAMIGTPAVKVFIDNLDFRGIDENSIPDEELRKAIISLKSERDTDKYNKNSNKLKSYLRTKYIFERLLTARPSRVLTFEKRLYTPRGENLVIDDIIYYFKEKYKLDAHLVKDKILPLYLGGLRLAEDIIFRKRQKQAKNQYYQGERPKDDLIFYEFKGEDLKTEDVGDALDRFYDFFIRNLGIEQSYQGQRIDFSSLITKDDFLNTMPKFLSIIRDSINKERFDVLDKKEGKKKVTLPERFSSWLDIGFLSYEISGEDLDYGEFLINQGGARVHARAFTDAASNAGKIIPNYGKIFEGLVTTIVKNKLGDAHSVEEFTAKNLTPLGKEICETLKSYAGKDEKDKTAIQIMMLLERIVGRDSYFRTLFAGDLLMWVVRKLFGSQASLAQDTFQHRYTRPTFAPNVDQMYTMMHKFLNDMDVPFEEEKIVGYEEKPILGNFFKIPVPKKEKNKYYVEQYEKIQGHTGWHRLKEKFIPLGIMLAIFVLWQLSKEARKRNQEK